MGNTRTLYDIKFGLNRNICNYFNAFYNFYFINILTRIIPFIGHQEPQNILTKKVSVGVV